MDYDSDLIFQHNKTGRDSNVRNMIRQGKVVERMVDETGIFCRVQWLDKQNLVSRPLPVKQQGSKGTSAMYCPKIGDDVSVTMLPNSDGGEGFIDGSFYTTSNPPPITDLDTRHITFADGTVIEYAEGNSTLKVDSKGPINIKCMGVCTIEAAGDATIKAPNVILDTPECRIKGNLTVEGTINIAEGMGGQTMTISGNIQHTGNMETSGTHRDQRGYHQ